MPEVEFRISRTTRHPVSGRPFEDAFYFATPAEGTAMPALRRSPSRDMASLRGHIGRIEACHGASQGGSGQEPPTQESAPVTERNGTAPRLGSIRGPASRTPSRASSRMAAAAFAAVIGISAVGAAADGFVPLLLPASDLSDHGRQGFVRVFNHSARAGEVAIQATDDEGTAAPAVTLAIEANAVAHFNSSDLEDGNPGKGLTGRTGAGAGNWRLELRTDLDIEALSFVRMTDGFLTPMHDTVPVENGAHRIATFNPASNWRQRSLLRIINLDSGTPATVSIAGVDDGGSAPGGGAKAVVPAGSSVAFSAADLEAGGVEGLEGSIGDGVGKWRLTLEADGSIVAMSLLSSPTGHLTNLSTASGPGASPPTGEFEPLLSASLQSRCVGCHADGGEAGRTRLVLLPDSNPRHWTANREALVRLMFHSDGGAQAILDKVQGLRGHGGGALVEPGTSEFNSLERALAVLEPEPAHESLNMFAEFVRRDDPESFRYGEVDSMRLRPGDSVVLGLRKGGRLQLGSPAWTSSDPSVVSMSPGEFKGVDWKPAAAVVAEREGQATITAMLNGQAASATVRVSPLARSSERSHSDRPDDFDGKQIHFVYVVQEGGRDGGQDTNGFLASLADEMQRWLRGAAGMRWRIDSHDGKPDISFLSIADGGVPTTTQILDALTEREGGALDPDKVHAFFLDYDGRHGRLPFTGIASSGFAVTLIHSPHHQQVAGIAAHELIHVFGAVPDCAPNREGPHSNDYDFDIMSNGTLVGGTLDWNSDDYFRHGRDDCLDTADSPYWEPIAGNGH